MIRRPPRSPLFPYPPLSRSRMARARGAVPPAAAAPFQARVRCGPGGRGGGGGVSGEWLAIDTATEIASVAAGRPPVAQSGVHVQGARRHAAEIIRLVDFALSRLSIRPADLEGVVVGDGPGSFTGLRIGWAAAKGLAHEAGLELRAIPSLMAAAAGAALKLGAEPVAACLHALPRQGYGALDGFHPDQVETLGAPAVLTMADLARVAPVRDRKSTRLNSSH